MVAVGKIHARRRGAGRGMSAKGRLPLRVVLTGPECTGKNTMAVHLARRFGVPGAMEYARIFLEERGAAYDYGLLAEMARGHVAYQRERVPESEPIGVFDTDLINYKIWCEVVFGRCHPEILAAMEREAGHVYLLCAADVPWEPDPLRENPNDRPALFEMHRREIERLGRKYRIVEGLGEDRVRNAEAAFEELAGLGGGA